jgi:hypothetical protein
VVGSDRIAEERECACVAHRPHARRLGRHPLEVRRILHVRRIVLPRVRLADRDFEVLPELVAAEDVGVLSAEELGLDAAVDLLLHFGRRRPDVAEEDRTIDADAERFALEVDVHASGERVGDDERRRREIVEARVWVDPSLEVAIARQY